MSRPMLVLACAIMLAACGRSVRSSAERQDDAFRAAIAFSGIEESLCPDSLPCDGKFVLRSWVDGRTQEVRHEVYVVYSYTGDSRLYSRAQGQNAEPLELVEIGRDVSCGSGVAGSSTCTHHEIFGVSLSDELLRERSTTGYALTVHARSGDELLIGVTPQQIRTQLAALARIRGGR